MTTLIRRLALKDMDAAAGVHHAAFGERLPWLADLHTADEHCSYFRGQVFTTCILWGAEEDGVILGIIAFREGWVDHLYVLPHAHRRGLGTALLRVAQTTFPSLSLWTFQKNEAARRFYEARGFVAVEMSDGGRNEEHEPDVLYRWTAIRPDPLPAAPALDRRLPLG